MTVALTFGCREKRAEHEAEQVDSAAAGHSKGEAAAEAERSPNGSIIVRLDDAARARIALATERAQSVTRALEKKAFGRALDPSPLVTGALEDAAARTTLDAATKELQRVQALAATQNASARTVEAAVAAAKQAQIAFDAARAKFLAAWGRALADRSDLGDLVHALAAGDAALVRVDLTAGETATPVGVRLVTLDGKTQIEPQLLGPAASVDPQTQGQGFLALVQPNSAHLTPGASVTAYLKLDGRARSGVVVPRSAVVRTDGKAWAYVRVTTDGFARQEVALDQPTEDGWFVTAGVAPGDEIVVTGAQMVLSEELKAALPAED